LAWASSLPGCHTTQKHRSLPAVMGGSPSAAASRTHLLADSSVVPSILALIFFLCLLIVDFIASRKKLGTLSSFSSSLAKSSRVVNREPGKEIRPNCARSSLCWATGGCRDGRDPARYPTPPRQDSPLVIGQLLLHQEQVGLQLVPLLQDLLQLFLGEAAVSRAPARVLVLRLLCGQRCSFLQGQRASAASGDPEAPTQRLGATCPQRWKSLRNEFDSPEPLQPSTGHGGSPAQPAPATHHHVL